jgi:hypothetical protein
LQLCGHAYFHGRAIDADAARCEFFVPVGLKVDAARSNMLRSTLSVVLIATSNVAASSAIVAPLAHKASQFSGGSQDCNAMGGLDVRSPVALGIL